MKFYRKQIEETEGYMKYRDLIRVLLKEDVKYSLEEADGLINEYLNGKESEE